MSKEARDPRLDALKAALDAREAEEAAKHAPAVEKRGEVARGFGSAYRIAIELVVGVCVGLAVGIWLDQRFGTAPLWTLLLVCLGFAAGIWNVVRWAQGYDESLGFRRKRDEAAHDLEQGHGGQEEGNSDGRRDR